MLTMHTTLMKNPLFFIFTSAVPLLQPKMKRDNPCLMDMLVLVERWIISRTTACTLINAIRNELPMFPMKENVNSAPLLFLAQYILSQS